MGNLNFLCKGLGGSRLYGLENADSDYDFRGVFASQDVNYILGLDCGERKKTFIDVKSGEDKYYFEVRGFLRSLKKCNTLCLELLFNKKWDSRPHPIFFEMQENFNLLMNSDQFFVSLTGGDNANRNFGYIGRELDTAFGQASTGRLGKRKDVIKKYGYSPKNAVQAMRLCLEGVHFYKHKKLMVNLKDSDHFHFLKSVKNNPENFAASYIRGIILDLKESLFTAFDQRDFQFDFCQNYANDILIRLYKPYLK